MKVLFVTSEAVPFIATGGLGDVCGALPVEVKKKGIDIAVVLPLYSDINDRYLKDMKFIKSFNVGVAWRNQYCGVFSYEMSGVTYLFLDNEYYFKRDGIYGHYDDAERFAFYNRAVLEMIREIDFVPDIIHLNDWQSSLVPVYLKLFYRSDEMYYGIKAIITIHNIGYQGTFTPYILGDVLGIPEKSYGLLSYDSSVNFLKSAIVESNRVTTVSPTYAKEILDPWYAYGLDPLLREYSYKVSGILNGIDTKSFNPRTDKSITANYFIKDLSNKEECKKALLKEFSLEYDCSAVIGIVSRLVEHKGFDLVKFVFEDILSLGVKIVMLGSGDEMYENVFGDFAKRYPNSFGFRKGYIPQLSRQIYAGSDMFLMPSKTEPCGLSQMIALRYGTIPIVRETGGLKDTVCDYGNGEGNGFTFNNYNAHDMLNACMRANSIYSDETLWHNLVVRAMRCDNSWAKAAVNYVGLYEDIAMK